MAPPARPFSATILITAIACLLVGGGAGFALGRRGGPAVAVHAEAVGDGGDSTGSPSQAGGTGDGIAASPGESDEPSAASPPPPGRKLTASELVEELKTLGKRRGNFFGMGGAKDMARLQEQLESQDLPELLKQLSAMPAGSETDPAWYLVVGQLAQRDPAAAWAVVQQMPAGNRKNSALVSTLAAVAQSDPARALSMAKEITDPSAKRMAVQSVIGSLSAQDPARAFELLTSEPGIAGGPADGSYFSIFHNWAAKDPEAAKAALGRLTGQRRDQAMQSFISGYASKDPQAAWEWARALPGSGEEWRDPRMLVIQSWAGSDPQAALAAARTLPAGAVRTRATVAALGNWAHRDFNGALEYTLGLPDSPERSEALGNIAGNAPDRPRMLRTLLEQMPPGDRFQNAVRNLFGQWASNDPAAAAGALGQISSGPLASSLASSIASQWAQSGDRSAALQWARGLPAGETRQNALGSLFGAWANDAPEEAVRSALSLPAAEQRQPLSNAARGWASRDPQAVLRWVQQAPVDDNTRREVTDAALNSWAQRSPAEAASWVDRLPAAQRERPLSVLVDRWASVDLPAAAEWLNAQPAAPERDAAVENLVRRLGEEDPEAAIAWAGSITDAQRRVRQIEESARRWLRYQPDAARAWITGSPALTPEAKARLLTTR
jgi:hypothetical protein